MTHRRILGVGGAVGLLAAVVALVGLVAAGSGPSATAQNGVMNGVPELGYMYSAKFLCGTIQNGEGPLADGEYATAINVHNLQDFEVHIYKKAVLAPVEPDVGVPSPYLELDVPSDAAFEIDCPDIIGTILGDPGLTFAKGFVVVQSAVELDVWGVYTSGHTLGSPTAGSGISEDIEVVAAKRQPLPELEPCIDREGDTQCDDPVYDADDDGCASWEEQAGAPVPKPGSTGAYDPNAWYDFYDVPVPAKADAAGANGTRNHAVNIFDVLAVVFYVGTSPTGVCGDNPNPNGVDYDCIKGVDLDGDTTNDITPPLHQIPEGVKYDRAASTPPNPPWEAGPPSGAVNIFDVLATVEQVGLACTGGPPPP